MTADETDKRIEELLALCEVIMHGTRDESFVSDCTKAVNSLPWALAELKKAREALESVSALLRSILRMYVYCE